MPFEQPTGVGLGQRPDTAPEADPDIGVLEVLPAAFRTENTIGSALSRETPIDDFAGLRGTREEPIDPNFDPITMAEEGGYGEHADSFIFVNNQEEFARVTGQIDRERADRELLNAAGGAGVVAGLVAGVLDPINFLPVGGAAVRVGRAAQAATRLGSAARGAVQVGKAGAVGATAAEVALHATQETRTLEESAFNIAGGAILSGVLGAAAGALSRADFQALGRRVERDVQDTSSRLDDIAAQERAVVHASSTAESVGAASRFGEMMRPETEAQARYLTDPAFRAEQDQLAGNAAARGYIASTEFLTPVMRTATSELESVRRIGQQLVENTTYYRKNDIGVASPQAVETALKLHRAKQAAAIRGGRQQYKAYRMRAAGTGEPVLKHREFLEQVSVAMRNGDQHAVPEVAATAKVYRSEVFEPLKQQAIELELLPPDVTPDTAVSYLSRVWNTQRIIQREPEFREIISKWAAEVAQTARRNFEEREGRRIQATEDTLRDVEFEQLQVQSELDALASRPTPKVSTRALGNLNVRRTGDRSSEEFAAYLEGKGLADVVNAVEYVNQKIPKPKTLIQFLRERGGLHMDPELEVLGIDGRRFPGLINNRGRSQMGAQRSLLGGGKGEAGTRDGMDLDAAREAATEEGYFGDPRDAQSSSIQDLLDAIKQDADGDPVVAYRDVGTLAMLDDQRMVADMLDGELNINPTTFMREQLDAFRNDRTQAKRQEIRQDAKAAEREARQFRNFQGALLRRRMRALETRAKKLREEAEARRRERDLQLRVQFDSEGAGRAYIEEITDHVVDTLKGMDATTMPPNITITTRGPLKERTLSIQDNLVQDFLENDVEFLADRITRIMGADNELKRQFGTVKFEDVQQDILREHNQRIVGVTDEKQLKKLDKEYRDGVRDLQGLWDIMRGQYKHDPKSIDDKFRRASLMARTVNYVRLLGGVTASSIPDLAGPIFVHGLGRTLGKAYLPLITNLRSFKMSVAEAKLAGQVTELELGGRIASLAELGDPYARGTALERFVQNTGNTFSRVNGLAYWNNAMKSIASVASQSRILDVAEKLADGKRVSDNDAKHLAFLGIDQSSARGIAESFRTHGSTEAGGVKLAGTEAWTDQNLVRLYRSALNKDVDRTILVKGVGDVPLAMNTQLGKVIGQFKSFMLAANQRILIPGLQRSDAAVLQGTVAMVAFGMMAYALKTWDAGRELSDDPRKWIIEGVDRSGLLSVIMEVNNIGEKMGVPGLNRLAGAAPASRFASRSAAESLVGPTFGLATNMAQVVQGVSSGELSESGLHDVRKLLPYQNLMFFRQLLDVMEENVAESLGVGN